jgi:hypothetical protein
MLNVFPEHATLLSCVYIMKACLVRRSLGGLEGERLVVDVGVLPRALHVPANSLCG